jgi:Putative peptidoglycan binding domain
VPVLESELLSSSADLQDVAQGVRRITAPEISESVALIQEALAAIEYSLPVAGIDDSFGGETGSAITAFKQSRGLSPSDPVVGIGTINRLDFEITYLEGAATNAHIADTKLLAFDPYLAGILELQQPGLDLTSRITDFFEFGDRMCFRLSFALSGSAAALVGRVVEPLVFADYCTLQAPCTPADFFDVRPGSTDYVDFLLVQHPNVDPAELGALGSLKRPDILRHRGSASEWYEIKPMSIAGAIAGRIKVSQITTSYARLGLPYKPGNTYTPTEHITLGTFFTPEGENLRVVVHLMRRARGLIFWELCIEGDYVAYFNRVRLVAGILALMIAAAELLAPAAEAAGIAAALRALAAELGAGLLPLVTAQ